MAEPIIELGDNSEIDENSDDELVIRNTDTDTEIKLSSFIDVVGGGFGDDSNRVSESFFDALDVDGTVKSTTTESTNLDFKNTIESPEEEDPATGTVTIDVSTSNWYDPIAATEDITVEVTNVDSGGNQLTLFFTDGDGNGDYTITYPDSFEWPNGTVRDTIPQDGNLEITAISPDGGTTWRARRSGEDFS